MTDYLACCDRHLACYTHGACCDQCPDYLGERPELPQGTVYGKLITDLADLNRIAAENRAGRVFSNDALAAELQQPPLEQHPEYGQPPLSYWVSPEPALHWPAGGEIQYWAGPVPMGEFIPVSSGSDTGRLSASTPGQDRPAPPPPELSTAVYTDPDAAHLVTDNGRSQALRPGDTYTWQYLGDPDPDYLPRLDGELLWPGVHAGCAHPTPHTHTEGGLRRLVLDTGRTLPYPPSGAVGGPPDTVYTGPPEGTVSMPTPVPNEPVRPEASSASVLNPPDWGTEAAYCKDPDHCPLHRVPPPQGGTPQGQGYQQGGPLLQGGTPVGQGVLQGVGQAGPATPTTTTTCPVTMNGQCPTRTTRRKAARLMVLAVGLYPHQIPEPSMIALERWLTTLHSTVHPEVVAQRTDRTNDKP